MKLEELNNLDWREPGRWPLGVRLGAIGIWFLLAFALVTYLLVWTQRRPELEAARAEESRLRDEFRDKHTKAVNLDLYKQQLADIERSFGAMLRQLPGRTEVPNLLVDISQTGLGAGLQQQLFQPMPQQTRDFYAELPIKIRLTGSYHQLGEFVSGIALLPRIVTLHDVEIKPVSKSAGFDQLQLDVTARTYRYLDEEEQQAVEEDKRRTNEGRPSRNQR
jgi:type IV pilus assembly protein PilO